MPGGPRIEVLGIWQVRTGPALSASGASIRRSFAHKRNSAFRTFYRTAVHASGLLDLKAAPRADAGTGIVVLPLLCLVSPRSLSRLVRHIDYPPFIGYQLALSDIYSIRYNPSIALGLQGGCRDGRMNSRRGCHQTDAPLESFGYITVSRHPPSRGARVRPSIPRALIFSPGEKGLNSYSTRSRSPPRIFSLGISGASRPGYIYSRLIWPYNIYLFSNINL